LRNVMKNDAQNTIMTIWRPIPSFEAEIVFPLFCGYKCAETI